MTTSHPETAVVSAPAALPATRLRPTASRRGGAPAAVGWIAAAALVASAGWFVYSLARPLSELDVVESLPKPPSVSVPARASDVGARDRVLAELTSGNPFSHRRKAWSSATAIADGTAPAVDAAGNPIPTAPAVALNPEQSVPADIKPAFDNLRLVGLFESAGKPAIMISFLTGDDPAKSHVYRVNDEIADKANPGATWRVLAVHLDRKSTVLLRAGKQVELRMFKDTPLPPPPVAAAPKPGVPLPPPVVVQQTRAEIIAQLREAKISEVDIAAMIAELGPDPDAPPTGEATAQAIEKALKPADGTGTGAPGGMEEILKMMAQRRAPAGTPPPPSTPTTPAAPPSPSAAPKVP